MCGIIGYIGESDATGILIKGLKGLEYRGYDSGGIAVLDMHKLNVVKAKGEIKNLEAKIKKQPPYGKLGIGHTRWATHGKANEINAATNRGSQIATCQMRQSLASALASCADPRLTALLGVSLKSGAMFSFFRRKKAADPALPTLPDADPAPPADPGVPAAPPPAPPRKAPRNCAVA